MKGKKLAGIICAGLGLIGLIGMATDKAGTALLVGSIVLIIVGAILLILGFTAKKKPEPPKPAPEQNAPQRPESVPSQLYLIVGDYVLRYIYDVNPDNPDMISARGHAGAELTIDEEGSLMMDGYELAVLTNPTMLDMARNYPNRNGIVKAYLRSVMADRLLVEIGFYLPKDQCSHVDRKFGASKKYDDCRSFCTVGDWLEILENDEGDGYVVECCTGPVGTLPASLELNESRVWVGEVLEDDPDDFHIRIYT